MLNFFPKIRPLAVISAIAVAAISVAPLVAQAANPTEATFSGSGVRSHGVTIINAQGSYRCSCILCHQQGWFSAF